MSKKITLSFTEEEYILLTFKAKKNDLTPLEYLYKICEENLNLEQLKISQLSIESELKHLKKEVLSLRQSLALSFEMIAENLSISHDISKMNLEKYVENPEKLKEIIEKLNDRKTDFSKKIYEIFFRNNGE